MAKRPIFVPDPTGIPYVETREIEFQWFAGFSQTQVRKSTASLHDAAKKLGMSPILEISRKSDLRLGFDLSAFELSLKTPDGRTISVECAYQGSKVFEEGGPYHDLYEVKSRAAKTDSRLRNSGEIKGFDYFGKEFPTEPQTAFYDWLYMTALSQSGLSVVDELKQFRAFSDIAFNPKRSVSCQARAAAIFVSLNHLVPNVEELLSDWDSYLRFVAGEERHGQTEQSARQLSLQLDE